MAAPKGNTYYKSRTKDGRERIFKTPAELLSRAYDYFTWCDENPWTRAELMRSGELMGTVVDVPMRRPYTLVGLCVYLGICRNTFTLYCERSEFSQACTHIREVVEQNQLEGATVGAYNASIISRMLGLKEHIDATSNDEPITRFEIEIKK